jgi:hypothetical protein
MTATVSRKGLAGVACAFALACLAALFSATTPAHAAPASLPTTATIEPSLKPDRLGAKAALTLAVRYSGGSSRVPSAVRSSVLQLPAGLALEIPLLRSCSRTTLLRDGAGACPRPSEIGHGQALAEVLAGSLYISEHVDLRVFLGVPDETGPTFEILARGYTPLDERMVFTGHVLPDNPPYGEKLELTIPPIATLPYEPAASIVSLSLTIGTHERPVPPGANSVLVPPSCPSGGFPFAAEFTYADGTSGNTSASAPCPSPLHAKAARGDRVRSGRARIAKTVSLQENGHLHLTSKHGFTLNEQGTATGTAAGTIYVHLTATSTTRMTVEVNIYPHGGSLSGHGEGSYHRVSGAAKFSGKMSISGGKGSYSHIRGSDLSFSGTIEESNHDAITVHVTGAVTE